MSLGYIENAAATKNAQAVVVNFLESLNTMKLVAYLKTEVEQCKKMQPNRLTKQQIQWAIKRKKSRHPKSSWPTLHGVGSFRNQVFHWIQIRMRIVTVKKPPNALRRSKPKVEFEQPKREKSERIDRHEYHKHSLIIQPCAHLLYDFSCAHFNEFANSTSRIALAFQVCCTFTFSAIACPSLARSSELLARLRIASHRPDSAPS